METRQAKPPKQANLSNPRQRMRDLAGVELCRRSAHYFIFDSGVVKTKDEHDLHNPSKTFPQTAYHRALLDMLLVSGRVIKPEDAYYLNDLPAEWKQQLYSTGSLFVEKSRQVMATWITCAYLTWRARFKPHQLILVQSKKEEDAAMLVFTKDALTARMSFIEHNLPKYMQVLDFSRNASYAHLYYKNGSHVWGIPQGAEVIRSNTPSVLFSDEAAFQEAFDGAYTSAKPALMGGGQMIAVSSANPGGFQSIVEG